MLVGSVVSCSSKLCQALPATMQHRHAKRQRTLFDVGVHSKAAAHASRQDGGTSASINSNSSEAATGGHRPLLRQQQALDAVPGLSYIPNFVSVQEEVALLQALDSMPWRQDIQRRTQHYGGYYVYSHKQTSTKRRTSSNGAAAEPGNILAVQSSTTGGNAGTSNSSSEALGGSSLNRSHSSGKERSGPGRAPATPPQLQFVTQRLLDRGVYPPDDPPTVLVINEYIGGQGISRHVDKFQFGDCVASLTLGSGCWMKLHQLDTSHLQPGQTVIDVRNKDAPVTGVVQELWLEPRSLVVMKGEARSGWQHEIPKHKRDRNALFRRVSVTYRTNVKKRSKAGMAREG